jgi:hypothetical protein
MGRDMFCNLRAQITFDSDCMVALKLRRPEAKILTLMVVRRRNDNSMTPRKRVLRCLSFHLRFWEYGLTQNIPLVMVELKPSFLLARGNTNFRPRPKLRSKSILTDDLHAVNSATVTLRPVVPNPYTLLGLIPVEAKFFTQLDLKDAFFCIRLGPTMEKS